MKETPEKPILKISDNLDDLSASQREDLENIIASRGVNKEQAEMLKRALGDTEQKPQGIELTPEEKARLIPELEKVERAQMEAVPVAREVSLEEISAPEHGARPPETIGSIIRKQADVLLGIFAGKYIDIFSKRTAVVEKSAVAEEFTHPDEVMLEGRNFKQVLADVREHAGALKNKIIEKGYLDLVYKCKVHYDLRTSREKFFISMGLLVGAGFIAREAFDYLNEGGTGTEMGVIGDVDDGGQFMEGVQDTAENAPEQAPKGATPAVETTVAHDEKVVVKSGDTMWGIIEKQLSSQGVLAGLSEQDANIKIDEIKDSLKELQAQSPKALENMIGIRDIENIKPGDTIDLSSVMDENTPSDKGAGGTAHSDIHTGTHDVHANGAEVSHGGEVAHHENADSGEESEGSEDGEMTTEEVVKHTAQSRVKEGLDGLFGSKGLFGTGLFATPGESSLEYKDMQGREVTEVLNKERFDTGSPYQDEKREAIGFDSPADVGKMKGYLSSLIDQSGVRPTEHERVADFIRRANEVQVARELGV